MTELTPGKIVIMDYERLSRDALPAACAQLAGADPYLAELVARNGVPPLWSRRPGFATLVQLIIEQQVSLASAAAVYARLKERLATVTPAGLLALSDAALLQCGFSRQKSRYCRLLAQTLVEGRWRLADMHRAPGQQAFEQLTAQTGIGPWTAQVYLLMALRHPDIWPLGDVALIRQFEKVMPVKSMESRRAKRRIRQWSPWRSVAARLLWHDYLIERNRA